jgi:GH25 family lysozyme M1 (1,4-beta-N-acetylmuramidase)
MLKGVDISKYQGAVNFDALKSAVDFVIMKASAGCPDPGQSVAQYVDGQFNRSESESRRVGLLRGFYHYAYPEYNDPEPEADQFFNAVGPLRDNEIMALDFEESTKKDVVQWCLRFLNHLSGKLEGYKPLLYINLALANAHDWSPVVQAGYGLWLAEWDFNANGAQPNTPWPFAAFRQYSDKESSAGMSPVDADVFYGDASSFAKYGFHNPNAQPAPSDTRDQQIADLNAKVNELTARLAEVSSKNSTDESQVAQLQSDVAQSKSVNDELHAMNDKLQAQVNDLTAQVKHLTENPVNVQLVPATPPAPTPTPTPTPAPVAKQSGWSVFFSHLFHK